MLMLLDSPFPVNQSGDFVIFGHDIPTCRVGMTEVKGFLLPRHGLVCHDEGSRMFQGKIADKRSVDSCPAILDLYKSSIDLAVHRSR
jgi:hypothetical protein